MCHAMGILNLQTLKVASLSLSTLSHLSTLPSLQDLHAPHNCLVGVEASDEIHTLFPSLELLDIGENSVESLQDLEALEELEGLVELKVAGNPFCLAAEVENYRNQICEMLPRLEMLDGVSIGAYFQ